MNRKQKMKAALDNLFSAPQPKKNQLTQEPTPAETSVPVSLQITEENSEKERVSEEALPILHETEEFPQSVHFEKSSSPQSVGDSSSLELKVKPEKLPAAAAVPANGKNPPGKTSGNGSNHTEKQLVVFQLCDEYYGLGIEAVEGIIKMQAITKVPHTPNYIRGVTNLRGTVLPVLDLRIRFGLSKKESGKDTRIIVLKSQGASVGVIVDAVAEVVRVPAGACQPSPSIAMSVDSSYVEGIARVDDRLIILLELEKILKYGSRVQVK